MQGDGFTLSENGKSAEARYWAEFFRASESKPFETMDASASYQDYRGDRGLTSHYANSLRVTKRK